MDQRRLSSSIPRSYVVDVKATAGSSLSEGGTSNVEVPAPGGNSCFVSVEEFRRFEEKVESDLGEIRGRLYDVERRVSKMEEQFVDLRKLEVRIVSKLKNSAMFHFQMAVHNLNKQLCSEVKLPPPDVESPKIYDLGDDGSLHEAEKSEVDCQVVGTEIVMRNMDIDFAEEGQQGEEAEKFEKEEKVDEADEVAKDDEVEEDEKAEPTKCSEKKKEAVVKGPRNLLP